MPPLNPEQLAAAQTRRGYFNVVSVPGCGKTTVFVNRAIAILKDGCPPERFLGLTFTKSAAEAMESRSGYTAKPGQPRIFRTFHGWALEFAKHEYQNFPFPVQHFPLLLPHEQYKILGPVLKTMRKRRKYKEVQSYISQCKRRDIEPEKAIAAADNEVLLDFAMAYRAYESKCQSLGKFDFDSLLSQSVRLLESRPDILARWQPEYLQCDEAQDNDAIQWRLIQLLGRRNVFVVGDPDQNMYTWRGAEPDGLTGKFPLRFPGAVRMPLSMNYRSTQEIIEYLNEIKPVKDDIVIKSACGHGPRPAFKRYLGEDAEAESILQGLVNPEGTAVLARTNRQLGAFEKAAGRLDMKYKLLGKSGFFSQAEVEFTVAFAQYCAGASTDDTVKKIISSPYDDCRYIKKHETLEELARLKRGAVGNVSYARLMRNSADPCVRELSSKLESTRFQVHGKGSQDALRTVITNFGILRHYEDDEDAVDNNPADNVMSLLRMAEKRSTLMDFVQLCHKAKQASRSTAKRLTFSTVHQAKGLEWKYVYVVGVNAEVLPHKNGDPDEERRIYFVACSRPEYQLEVSCNDLPSPFIAHKLSGEFAGQGHVDFLDVMYRAAAEGAVQ